MTGDRVTPSPVPSPGYEPLDALVGTWATRGRTIPAGDEPATEIIGTDTYAWFPGGRFVQHTVDVSMDGAQVDALEFIGEHDPATGSYAARSFDASGAFTTMGMSVDADGVWTLRGDTERARLTVAADGASMAARWERTADGVTWRPWLAMDFTRRT